MHQPTLLAPFVFQHSLSPFPPSLHQPGKSQSPQRPAHPPHSGAPLLRLPAAAVSRNAGVYHAPEPCCLSFEQSQVKTDEELRPPVAGECCVARRASTKARLPPAPLWGAPLFFPPYPGYRPFPFAPLRVRGSTRGYDSAHRLRGALAHATPLPGDSRGESSPARFPLYA